MLIWVKQGHIRSNVVILECSTSSIESTGMEYGACIHVLYMYQLGPTKMSSLLIEFMKTWKTYATT